jgi:nucleotide-binding universal stress UspA family protein
MKRILVAVDGSPRAPTVLKAAVELARATGGKIILFRSFGIPPDMTLAWPISDEPLETVLRAEARKYLDDLARTVPALLLESERVALGSPWQAVCAAARDENVDLIFIGSHGFGGIDHLLGTTAAKIVNHADRSVLVVRAKD